MLPPCNLVLSLCLFFIQSNSVLNMSSISKKQKELPAHSWLTASVLCVRGRLQCMRRRLCPECLTSESILG
ncbi:uncharacterized protein FOBCDRAFT_222008 [Fusarium oxysporum Fo47]|uniref:uncharacterized protein n=1 Tax=Fusarium oxysporum Fo47 TaxID=660027 RepID=UPI002869E84B|nr:uncharacterized protein FOBCDRAFT_222008 [Fusarium oxysporum Fo47]WJG35210.1 hypothetical protein FOBCDRAFT_222008 [Fusarium oxysporum Fo47]